MMTGTIQASLEMNLKELKLPMMLRQYGLVAREVLEENLSCEQYLHRLTQCEVDERHKKKIVMLLKNAHFPKDKKIDDFNFNSLSNIKKESVLELCQGHFLNDFTNLIFYGVPGTGKTHLAMGIGRELCLKGYKVVFFTGCTLVQELSRHKNNLTLTSFFKRIRSYDLVIIDELGFIPFERGEGDLLFQFISDRYERGSLLITSNLVFSEWDKVFKDPITTSAAIDRLVHHSLIFEFKDESYRTQVAKKRLKK
jgi:DNA replication protein DnaC